MQYTTFLMAALSIGASASAIPTSSVETTSSTKPTSSATSTSSAAQGTPSPTGNIHDPNSYTKYAKIEKDTRPEVMECYVSIKMDDPQCEDNRSARIGRYDPQQETCERK
jgi:hypothetical protein